MHNLVLIKGLVNYGLLWWIVLECFRLQMAIHMCSLLINYVN